MPEVIIVLHGDVVFSRDLFQSALMREYLRYVVSAEQENFDRGH